MSRSGASAATVAGKYLSEAQGNAWPAGLALEAEFFKAIGIVGVAARAGCLS